MSEIGLVQAAMKEVDKISKKKGLILLFLPKLLFFQIWLIDLFDSLILYTHIVKMNRVQLHFKFDAWINLEVWVDLNRY